MNLEDMDLFVQLAKHGSFTKAADATDIPKSTISRRITNLEKHLGVQLLARTTRKLSLTEVGENYLQGCQSLIEQAKRLEQDTQQQNDEPSGTLSIFIPNTLLRVFWPVVIEMINDYPELKFEAFSSEGRQEDQTTTRYDIMFHVDEPKDSSLIARRVSIVEYDYYASPAYIAKHGLLQQPSDVEKHQIIFNSVSQSPVHFWRFDYQGEIVQQAISPFFSVQNPELGLDLCLQDKGIALVPHMLSKELVQQGKLVKAYAHPQQLSGYIYAIYHSRKFLPAKVRIFIDKLQRFLEAKFN
ncbi:LysR family transcriptional regulator [Agarivorans sp. Toyoura001]|uniref:LysR family transcriptional regulator n=1 Tax=unclassified Agarivorans TaxID=2636026 RepID=UPI0010D0D527|nr:LysR family transcriptional regulator [Agarivorans sp. Toyoura001]GDY26936.1 LysR family transcriptional regulator [Agarivorans sp. Toyoura001]